MQFCDGSFDPVEASPDLGELRIDTLGDVLTDEL
jgi:hypothetical protein